MVYYFTCNGTLISDVFINDVVVSPPVMLYMGKDKFESIARRSKSANAMCR